MTFLEHDTVQLFRRQAVGTGSVTSTAGPASSTNAPAGTSSLQTTAAATATTLGGSSSVAGSASGATVMGTTTAAAGTNTQAPVPDGQSVSLQPHSDGTQTQQQQTLSGAAIIGLSIAAFAILIFVIGVVLLRRGKRKGVHAKGQKLSSLEFIKYSGKPSNYSSSRDGNIFKIESSMKRPMSHLAQFHYGNQGPLPQAAEPYTNPADHYPSFYSGIHDANHVVMPNGYEEGVSHSPYRVAYSTSEPPAAYPGVGSGFDAVHGAAGADMQPRAAPLGGHHLPGEYTPVFTSDLGGPGGGSDAPEHTQI